MRECKQLLSSLLGNYQPHQWLLSVLQASFVEQATINHIVLFTFFSGLPCYLKSGVFSLLLMQLLSSYTSFLLKVLSFILGDSVLILMPVGHSKLEASYAGPFTVVEQVSTVTYRLDMPGQGKKGRIVHINLMKQWTTPTVRHLQ